MPTSTKQKVWVVWGESESGDSVSPHVFATKPTREQKISVIKSIGEDIEIGGPGNYGSYVYLAEQKTMVQ